MKKGRTQKLNRSELIWRLLVIILGAVFLFCILTNLITPLFMVHPGTDAEAAGYLESRDDIQKISVNGVNSLSGYLRDDPDSDILLVYFYGISDDAASGMKMLLDNSEYDNIDIAVVDWPSYGESRGFASSDAIKAAAVDTVYALTKAGTDVQGGEARQMQEAELEGASYSCSNVIIMGYSMGTGPAVYAASQCGCLDLILLSPYYSTNDLYNSITPVFYGPFENLPGFSIRSAEYAKNVTVSPLIVASESDSRVPYESSVRLSECFEKGCELESFPDITHGDIPHDPEVLELIRQRLDPYR